VKSLTSAKPKRFAFVAAFLPADGIAVHHVPDDHAFSALSGASVQELHVAYELIVKPSCEDGFHPSFLAIDDNVRKYL